MSNLESFDATEGTFDFEAVPEIRWEGRYEWESFSSLDETHFSHEEIAQLCSGDETRFLDRQNIMVTWNGMATMFDADSENVMADILAAPYMERGIYQIEGSMS